MRDSDLRVPFGTDMGVSQNFRVWGLGGGGGGGWVLGFRVNVWATCFCWGVGPVSP